MLVNRFTASASEIFAAAIQDYHRGVVVGSVTYGKGTVQQVKDLSRFIPGDTDAGQLKLTMDKFYRVTGSSTQHKGVVPDIALPALIDPTEFGESANPSALPWDEIKSSDFTPLKAGLDKALPQLTTEHNARIAKDQSWKLFTDSVHDMEVERAQTSISLVLADRQKQRTDDDAKKLATLNAWRKLKGLAPATTLEDALKAAKPDTSEGSDADAGGIAPDVLLVETASIAADIGAQGLFPGQPAAAVADANRN